MPPKAAGKAKKSKKSAKPDWLSDDVWAVSQDLPALLNSFAGIQSDKPAKSDKGGKTEKAAASGKGGKGAKAEPLPNIPKAQVQSSFVQICIAVSKTTCLPMILCLLCVTASCCS